MVAVLSLLVITPVVAFYLLYDWDRMLAGVDALLPRQHAATIRDLGRQMSGAIAGFVRGQSLVVLILGIFYATALAVIGLHFGLIIGLVAGLLSFIPFVGTATGFIVSVGVATAQWGPGGDWVWVIVTVAIFVAGQVLEGNYLQPKIIGNCDRPASRLADLRAARLHRSVRLRRHADRRADVGDGRRAGPLRHQAIPAPAPFYGGGAPPETAAEGEAGAKE